MYATHVRIRHQATPKNHAIDHGGKQTGHMKRQKAWQRGVSLPGIHASDGARPNLNSVPY